MTIYYNDARDAIRDANAAASSNGCAVGIAYARGRGWVLQADIKQPWNHTPEFICFGLGRIPLPLTPEAIDVWASCINTCVH